MPTIGYGRNLRANPLSPEEQLEVFKHIEMREAGARYLLEQDIKNTWIALLRAVPWVGPLSDNRKRGIINMAFQLGITGFLGFKNSIKEMKEGNWEKAGERMRQSLWYTQTSNRAERVINLIEKG